MTILVTGATGRVGGQVLALLRRAGAPVRALARDPARLPAGVDAVRGDLSDPASIAAATDGAASVFLVFPTLRADPVAPAVVDALAEHAGRIVYLSAAGASDERDGILGSHGRLERLIERSGVEWTFLRPSGFAANTLAWADQIRRGDVVRWFHGAASRSLIHEYDIGAVAVRALTEDGHVGARHHLTGPGTLTQVEQVHAIGTAIGRPLRFQQLPPEEARRTLFADFPPAVAESIMDTHADMIRHPEPVTTTVADLTGRPARTFPQWAADHAADFLQRLTPT